MPCPTCGFPFGDTKYCPVCSQDMSFTTISFRIVPVPMNFVSTRSNRQRQPKNEYPNDINGLFYDMNVKDDGNIEFTVSASEPVTFDIIKVSEARCHLGIMSTKRNGKHVVIKILLGINPKISSVVENNGIYTVTVTRKIPKTPRAR